jgi:hypothetical protein
MSMILLEPAYKILHTTGEVQAADHLSNTVLGEVEASNADASTAKLLLNRHL